MKENQVSLEGNEAAAYVAYRTNEVVAIYPITPSSGMGEFSDDWSARGIKNMWGTVPDVVEMQSEGGAAGAVHGSLQAGSLTTTFTASQGLLLMIPNMYKIAGELTSTVFHIAARSLSAQALSIFGDHSDVMACRSTGFGMLFSNSIQEIMDMALIAQACTLESRVPFLHVFDGFRSSHEIQKIDLLSDENIRAMITEDSVRGHRERAMSPDRPFIRGTAQNPDVFFQARETINPYYIATPGIVQKVMDKFAGEVGRKYNLFDYVGAPDAERVIVLMGSGCETAEETVDYLTAQGEKVGLLKVRLYRPFSIEHFLGALPSSVKVLTALDRAKEPGAIGEPLYQDLVTAVNEGKTAGTAAFDKAPRITGGRYGLSSKEFTPAMVKGVFDEMAKPEPKNHFTVGINDDVTHTSIDYDPAFNTETDDVTRAVFFGLGSDGTVGANKNSIKIIGEDTDFFAQGYFVYDSKKAGAQTISHLRFGPRPIKSTYLITHANFVAVHQFGFIERYDILTRAAEGATFLLNSPYGPDEIWDKLPRVAQEHIINKKIKFYVIDAYKVAAATKMGVRINTIMQTGFFALSGVLPQDEAIQNIKNYIQKTYGKRGEEVVKTNFAAVDGATAELREVTVPDKATSTIELPDMVPADAPEFVKNVTATIMAGRGGDPPVSLMTADGTYPSGTTEYEKRNIALSVPVWEPDLCIQCGKCSLVCPHAVIRSKLVGAAELAEAPAGFKEAASRWKKIPDKRYTLQVSVNDCTGCQLCVQTCPTKDKQNPDRKAINMTPRLEIPEEYLGYWDFFSGLSDFTQTGEGDGILQFTKVKDVQLKNQLFEFSGACAGCGETPYLKVMCQLFGDRALVANATGCSSIYGGNLPTTPYAIGANNRGPAWSNSLFEDNAEFGMGMRLALDKQSEFARERVAELRGEIGEDLAGAILNADQSDDAGINTQRERVAELKKILKNKDDVKARDLLNVADTLVKKSVWIVGGDGWAYDIGYGGLDHVLASGRNVNLLVLDTEVYSNTGGQSSKATPLGAVAKFAAGGKRMPKKDLGLMAMSYGSVYVAQIAMGASDAQTLKAFTEAESYDGPSLIIAYSHCIAHGIDMTQGLNQQKMAQESGAWPLYRFDPRLRDQGKNPFQLDVKKPKIPIKDYMYNETRFRMLTQSMPEIAERLLNAAQENVNERWRTYEQMAQREVAPPEADA
jgi:pyruvate-ferredoxin/flavodoxin oxidoreductase